MNIGFQRVVDQYVGSFLCRVFSLIPKKLRDAPLQQPRRICIILLSEMGSLVLAYPMMSYLKEHYPETQLHALVFERNREVIELFEVMEKENILTIRDDSITDFLCDSVRALQKLRSMKLDAVIDCELFTRISSLLSFLSGAPIRAGFHPYTQEGLYRGNFINRAVLYNPYLHISRQFLNLAYALESNTTPKAKHSPPTDSLKAPIKQFSATETNAFSVRLQRNFPQLKERIVVLIYPSGGVLPVRAWPLESYCQLSKALTNKGLSVGIIGQSFDRELGQQIVDFADSKYCFNLTGHTRTIRELLLLLQQADLLVTNDGGPSHFSAIASIPSITLFGPESPQLYAPLSSRAYCFYQQLACSPCLTAYNHRNSPCDGDNQCLKHIGVQEVLEKVMDKLPTPPSRQGIY